MIWRAAVPTAAGENVCAGDRYISYLPLAHIYERGGLTLQTFLGGAIGFYRCASPAQPSPAQPSPAQPSPAQPSPAQPSPAQPSRQEAASLPVG